MKNKQVIWKVNIRVEANGVPAIIMIDISTKVSLINNKEFEWIKMSSEETIPVYNISLIGVTGCQNETDIQVLLDLSSNKVTISITFLITSNLPFIMLIGFDIL